MSQRHVQSTGRPGFSLVETIAAMAITGIVLSTSIGALQLVARHGPRLERVENVQGQMGVMLHRMRSELRLATAVEAVSTTSIRIVIPDANGDAIAETVEYGWSGVAGAPLLRTENAGPVVAVIQDLQHFAFTVTAESVIGTADTQSAEVVLFSHEATKSVFDYSVATGYSYGQYFTPTLPAEATSWSVTRLQIKAKKSGAASGVTSVALHRSLADRKPAATALETNSMSEAPLGTQSSWQPFAYSSVVGLSPSEGLCVVLKSVASSPSCGIEYQDGVTGGGLFESTDGGGTWTVQDDKRMQLYVWGKYAAPEATQVAGALLAVHIKAEALPENSLKLIRVNTAVTCLNRPSLGGFALGSLPIERIVPTS